MRKQFTLLCLVLLCCCIFSACQCEHEWSEATCTAPKTCTLCNETDGEPLGHTWREADCNRPRTCTVCKSTEGEPLLHDWKEADCTFPKRCTLCGYAEGSALGHDYKDKITIKESTCSEKGKEKLTCVTCGHESERSIAKLPHTEGEWITTREATWYENGLMELHCAICNDVIDSKYIELSDEEKESLYKKQCEKYSYKTIARNPDKYMFEYGYVYGEVVQVIEDGNDYTLRIAMNGDYSSMILVTYERPASQDRILEDDMVKLYGMWMGTCTYESTSGKSITIPYFMCEYLDIQY